MKTFLSFFQVCLFLVLSGLCSVEAQDYDTIPQYQKDSTLPLFSIMQTDSSWFNNLDLPKNKNTIIIYFSPECGHCQLTAREYMQDMKRFKDVFFIWVSYQPMGEIQSFADTYKMLHVKNLVIGRDPKYYVPSYYRVKFTPYVAVYNKEGRLLQTFDGGTDPDTLYRLLYPAEN